MRFTHATEIKFNTHVFFSKVLVRLFLNSLHFHENWVPQLTWFDSFTFSYNIKKIQNTRISEKNFRSLSNY